jgi:hypothetical protein
VTISYFPSCSADLDPTDCTLANLFYEPVGGELTGKVIVLASNGYHRHLDGRRHEAAAAPGERRHWAPEDISVPKSARKNAICDCQALDPQARERTELQGLRRC